MPRQSLRSLPTQSILWFFDSMICMMMGSMYARNYQQTTKVNTLMRDFYLCGNTVSKLWLIPSYFLCWDIARYCKCLGMNGDMKWLIHFLKGSDNVQKCHSTARLPVLLLHCSKMFSSEDVSPQVYLNAFHMPGRNVPSFPTPPKTS